MSPHKIAVLGSINEDFIIHKRKQKHSYGGILYNLVALASLLPETKIHPVAFLGKNVWPKVGNLTPGLNNLDWHHARKLKQKTNQVRLLYLPNGEKREILKHPVPKFAWSDLRPALQGDALLLNFISGWEISPRLFQKFRRKYAGVIHVDYHSLLLGIRKNGARFRRIPKDWPVFLDADFVQMNQREWELVAGTPFSRKNLIRFCRRWGRKKWQVIIVTLAEIGAVLAYRNKTLSAISCPAPRVKNPEQTGAGDFFAAGFLSATLKGKSWKAALRQAVRTASWKCRYEGIESVLEHRHELKRFLTPRK
ncbi:MAG TPA: carbohydrate kinase family protein [Verrucomicrobiae bacterium]|nr:carbohydrate kinase family protein [Verrucomicrobiae bacterium]